LFLLLVRGSVGRDSLIQGNCRDKKTLIFFFAFLAFLYQYQNENSRPIVSLCLGQFYASLSEGWASVCPGLPAARQTEPKSEAASVCPNRRISGVNRRHFVFSPPRQDELLSLRARQTVRLQKLGIT
jgi:hypothetical protein